LGRAAEIGQNYAQASRYFMSVAILYDDPKLVPEALYRAALSYDRLKRAADRDKAAQELVQRYPQSSWTRKVDKSWLH
jgi:TolA-binding protein